MRKRLLAYGVAMSLTLTKVFALDSCYGTACDPFCYDFNGIYFGGNIGVLSDTAYRGDLNGLLFTTPSGWNAIDTKFMGGIQLGYDWQYNNKLLGLVGDWNWTNTNKRVNVVTPGGEVVDTSVRSKLNWVSTVRLRAGVTVCDALFYVTAGAAAGRFKTSWNSILLLGGPQASDQVNRNRWGWTAGAGTEFMLGCRWSLAAEVLFLEFSQYTQSFPYGTSSVALSHSDSVWLGRIMLNYRFSDLLCSCY